MSLDVSQEIFEKLLQRSNELILKQFQDVSAIKGYHSYPQPEVEAWFDEPLPRKGMGAEALFQEVQEKVIHPATGNLGPHMYAYVMAGGTQMSIIAEQLAATINQNNTKWHLAPSMHEIEKRVVRWTGELMQLPYHEAGIMVSGGSAANLAGLQVARNVFFEQQDVRRKGLFGQKPFVVYASKEVHGCVDKSLDTLGIGLDNLRRLPVHEDYTLDLEALETHIQDDAAAGLQPFCIIGNAGTVNTGAIDPLDALADIAEKYQLWFHVDGAYGGLASAIPSLRKLYNGIERADSIALDFHKWLYQPFEAGCLLVKDWETLKKAYFKKADYLDTAFEPDQGKRIDFNEHYFQLSRNAKAFKVWMSLKFYGADRMVEMIQQDITLTHYLAKKVKASRDFRLKSVSELAVACFQYTAALTDQQAIIRLNQQLIPALEEDGRVFIAGTKLHGEFVIRACLINHRKTEESTNYLLDVIREVGQLILTKQVPIAK